MVRLGAVRARFPRTNIEEAPHPGLLLGVTLVPKGSLAGYLCLTLTVTFGHSNIQLLRFRIASSGLSLDALRSKYNPLKNILLQ